MTNTTVTHPSSATTSSSDNHRMSPVDSEYVVICDNKPSLRHSRIMDPSIVNAVNPSRTNLRQEYEKEFINLKIDLAESRGECDHLKSEVRRISLERDDLAVKLAKLESEAEACKAEKQKMASVLKVMREMVEHGTYERTTLRAQAENSLSQKEQYESRYEKLAKENRKLKNERKLRKTILEQTRRELEDSRRECKMLRDSVMWSMMRQDNPDSSPVTNVSVLAPSAPLAPVSITPNTAHSTDFKDGTEDIFSTDSVEDRPILFRRRSFNCLQKDLSTDQPARELPSSSSPCQVTSVDSHNQSPFLKNNIGDSNRTYGMTENSSPAAGASTGEADQSAHFSGRPAHTGEISTSMRSSFSSQITELSQSMIGAKDVFEILETATLTLSQKGRGKIQSSNNGNRMEEADDFKFDDIPNCDDNLDYDKDNQYDDDDNDNDDEDQEQYDDVLSDASTRILSNQTHVIMHAQNKTMSVPALYLAIRDSYHDRRMMLRKSSSTSNAAHYIANYNISDDSTAVSSTDLKSVYSRGETSGYSRKQSRY